jgi:hypothetical protein
MNIKNYTLFDYVVLRRWVTLGAIYPAGDCQRPTRTARNSQLADGDVNIRSGRGRSMRCLTARRPNNLGADC